MTNDSGSLVGFFQSHIKKPRKPTEMLSPRAKSVPKIVKSLG